MPAFYELNKSDAGPIAQGSASETEPRTRLSLAFARVDNDKALFVLMRQWHEGLLLAYAAGAAQLLCTNSLVVLFVNNKP